MTEQVRYDPKQIRRDVVQCFLNQRIEEILSGEKLFLTETHSVARAIKYGFGVDVVAEMMEQGKWYSLPESPNLSSTGRIFPVTPNFLLEGATLDGVVSKLVPKSGVIHVNVQPVEPRAYLDDLRTPRGYMDAARELDKPCTTTTVEFLFGAHDW